LKLNSDNGATGQLTNASFYWSVAIDNKDGQLSKCVFPDVLSAKDEHSGILMIAFVDKTFPSIFSSVVSGGVIAMYAAVVLVVGRLIRSLVTNDPLSVIIQEMPNVDRLLKICRDIYVVREAGDFSLEQDLFARLIFLFRSPETLIKWTRQKLRHD